MEIRCRATASLWTFLNNSRPTGIKCQEEVRSLFIPVRRTGLRSWTLVRFRLAFSHRLPLISNTCPASCR
jgi:hypothetical protein